MEEDLFGSTNKRILLIEPPFYRFFHYERWHYPITLTLIATYLKEKGQEAKVYDADKPTSDCKSLTRCEVRKNYHMYEEALENDVHPIWLEIREKIKEFNPQVVGLTSVTAKIDSANKIAKMCKELYGDKFKVVLGGPHAQGMRTMLPDYDFGPYYDKIVTFIPCLVDRFPNKKLLLDYENYRPKYLSTILTSTGCPNKCTFCCNSTREGMVYRSIDSIKKEIKELKDNFGIDTIHFVDDCFLSYKRRFYQMVDLLSKHDLKFHAASRIMALSKEKIKTYIENGGLRIHVGVESGSQRILDLIKKRLKISEVIKRTKWLRDFEADWQAFFMAGFPFETLEEIKMSEELAYKIEPTFISLNRFTPYPGTAICNEYYRDSKFEFKDVFQLSPKSVVKLDNETEEYIEKMYIDFDAYNQRKKLLAVA